MNTDSVEIWKSLVDDFAKMSDGVQQEWITKKASYPATEENRPINVFLQSLSQEQLNIVAEMVAQARHGGIHDALVVFNDRIALKEGQYFEGGTLMEFQPFGSELYYDYTSRKMGEEWPG
jgi:hypothetical protein